MGGWVRDSGGDLYTSARQSLGWVIPFIGWLGCPKCVRLVDFVEVVGCVSSKLGFLWVP